MLINPLRNPLYQSFTQLLLCIEGIHRDEIEPVGGFDGGERISYNHSLEKTPQHSWVMSQADPEPRTEPELHFHGER